ncbi:MAG: MBL fold metallo-hydrolase [Actinobacteria bacterium]|nr:MBL fold metallo-hydrolase [Actinomycetota bacterium]
MDLVMTGTGSPLPSPDRAGPSQLVQVGARSFLVDCGRGCLMRLAGAASGPAAIEMLLLTHLHSDHVTDVNDLITTRWIGGFPAAPLPVVGPEGTSSFIDDTLTMLGPDIGWRIAHHDDLEAPPDVPVTETAGGIVFEDDEVRIIAAPTDHRPVQPTVAYRIEADGYSVVLAGDTVPCSALDELCADADVYVQTVIRDDLISRVPIARLNDVIDYHSTVVDAAQTATRSGVGTLVLNHCVPAPMPGTEADWIAIAAEHFDGGVLLPADLDRIPVEPSG